MGSQQQDPHPIFYGNIAISSGLPLSSNCYSVLSEACAIWSHSTNSFTECSYAIRAPMVRSRFNRAAGSSTTYRCSPSAAPYRIHRVLPPISMRGTTSQLCELNIRRSIRTFVLVDGFPRLDGNWQPLTVSPIADKLNSSNAVRHNLEVLLDYGLPKEQTTLEWSVRWERAGPTFYPCLVDSTPLTGHLIADALRKDRDLLTIAHAEADSALAIAKTLKTDVAIISEQLQGEPGKGFDFLRDLRVVGPSIRTVMLFDVGNRDLVVEAFRSGARGVFCRQDPLKMLTRCVHKVHEGQLWVSGPELQFLLEALAHAPATRLVDTQGMNLLSNREQDVVRWLAEGHTNSEIGRKMNISDNTVKNYLFRIFNKLGVSSRVEVVIYAANQRAASQ